MGELVGKESGRVIDPRRAKHAKNICNQFQVEQFFFLFAFSFNSLFLLYKVVEIGSQRRQAAAQGRAKFAGGGGEKWKENKEEEGSEQRGEQQ